VQAVYRAPVAAKLRVDLAPEARVDPLDDVLELDVREGDQAASRLMANAKREALLGINVAGNPRIRLERFLSGSRLLSNQTFRDLFPSETLLSAEGLMVKHIAPLHRHQGLNRTL
jgi:hypothetical protein